MTRLLAATFDALGSHAAGLLLQVAQLWAQAQGG